MNILGLQNYTREKALNDILLTERQKGEREERVNIPTSKLRGSCLRNSNVSNDTDKSLGNSNAEINDVAKQTVVSYAQDNSDNVALRSTHDKANENNKHLLQEDKMISDSSMSNTSSVSKVQNIYRSKENLSKIEGDEVENSCHNMENIFQNGTPNFDQQEVPPSDEEIKGFLEYMEEKGAMNDEDIIQFEVDQLRKRTAAELG